MKTTALQSAMAIGLIAVIAASATAQVGADPDRKPDLEPVRVAAELTVGTYAGYVGYFAGRFVGVRAAEVFPRSSEGAREAVANAFGYLGGALATTGAVYGLGSLGDQTGDFPATLLGTGAGFAVAMLANYVFLEPARAPQSSGNRAMRRAAEFIEVFLPAIGATIGFNSTRRFDR